MITVRKAKDRGRANFGWLNSKHSFSFGRYYDPKHMGFSALRVINDDIVQGGTGFETHGHRDMEIISYVLEGKMEHKDSAGNIQTLPVGEFQLMSAGKGIYHSEYNASASQKLRFLQIWIEPSSKGGNSGYQQKAFGKAEGMTEIASNTGSNGSLKIKQHARLHQLFLSPNTELLFETKELPNIYIHHIQGGLTVNDTTLEPGDGASITNERVLTLTNTGEDNITALVFELP